MFGLYGVAFVASITACYIAQIADIKIYLWLRKLTQGRWLWLRNNGSTAVSLFLDTCIVVGVMTMFDVLPRERVFQLIIHSYLFKFFFTICSTPLFYIGFLIIRLLIKTPEDSNSKDHQIKV